MTIERTISGVIEYHFGLLERVADDKDVSLEKAVDMSTKLAKEIRSYSALHLAHMRELRKAPDIARKHDSPRLVNGSSSPAGPDVGQATPTTKPATAGE